MATPATPPAPAPAVAVIPGFQLYNSLVSTSTTIIDTRPRKGSSFCVDFCLFSIQILIVSTRVLL